MVILFFLLRRLLRWWIFFGRVSAFAGTKKIMFLRDNVLFLFGQKTNSTIFIVVIVDVIISSSSNNGLLYTATLYNRCLSFIFNLVYFFVRRCHSRLLFHYYIQSNPTDVPSITWCCFCYGNGGGGEFNSIDCCFSFSLLSVCWLI